MHGPPTDVGSPRRTSSTWGSHARPLMSCLQRVGSRGVAKLRRFKVHRWHRLHAASIHFRMDVRTRRGACVISSCFAPWPDDRLHRHSPRRRPRLAAHTRSAGPPRQHPGQHAAKRDSPWHLSGKLAKRGFLGAWLRESTYAHKT